MGLKLITDATKCASVNDLHPMKGSRCAILAPILLISSELNGADRSHYGAHRLVAHQQRSDSNNVFLMKNKLLRNWRKQFDPFFCEVCAFQNNAKLLVRGARRVRLSETSPGRSLSRRSWITSFFQCVTNAKLLGQVSVMILHPFGLVGRWLPQSSSSSEQRAENHSNFFSLEMNLKPQGRTLFFSPSVKSSLQRLWPIVVMLNTSSYVRRSEYLDEIGKQGAVRRNVPATVLSPVSDFTFVLGA